MARKIEVQIVGDERDLTRAFNRGGKAGQKFGKDMSLVGRVSSKTGANLGLLAKGAGLAGVALGTGAVLGAKKATDAFREAEVSNAKLRAQLKASGISYKAHAKEIDAVIQRTSKLAGLDDEDLQDAFTNIIRVTGNVSKSMKLTGLAADFARAKHMDVAKAGELVGKVAGGNVGILGRYGISVKKGATATEALGLLQRKFAGQAEAYGKTGAGAQDRMKVSTENLMEAVGRGLDPTLTKVQTKVADFVNGMVEGTGAGGRFKDSVTGAFNGIKTATAGLRAGIETAFDPSDGIEAGDKFQRAGLLIGTAFRSIKTGATGAVASVRGWVRDNRAQINQVIAAFQNVARVVRTVVTVAFNLALATVRRAMPGIKTLVEGSLRVIGGIVKVFSGVLTGDFRGAWNGVRQIFSGAMKVLVGMVRAGTAPIREAASRIGKGIVSGVRGAVGGVRSAVTGVAKGAVAVLHSWGARFVELGKNLILGLVDGIKSKAADVANAAGDAAKGAVDGVKGLLGIRSPSKVFAEIGGWVAQGLAEGIVGGKSMVDAAVHSGLLYPLDAAIATLTAQKDKLQASFDKWDQRRSRRELVAGIATAGREETSSPSTGSGSPRASTAGLKAKSGNVVQWLSGLARAAGLTVTSTTGGKHVAGSNHYKGLAIDAAGTPAKMAAFFDSMVKRFGPKIKELFYDPKGGIKDGKKIGAIGGHGDHVHAAVDSVLAAVGKGMSGAGAKATGKLTANQVRGLAYAAGFRGHDLDVAVAVAMAESGGKVRAQNKNTNGTTDRGIFQINSTHGAGSTFDVNKNTAAAYSLYKNRGGFKDWVAYNSGAYKKYMGKTGSGKGSMSGLSGMVKGGDGSSIADAIKGLKDFDREALRASKLAAIDLKIKGLEALKAYKDAIGDLTDSIKELAGQGASAFRSIREAQIDADPLNAELAGLQAQDAKEQRDRSERDLKKTVADAQWLVDHSGGQTHTDALQQLADAKQDLDAFYRKDREDKISADLQAQRDGLDKEESNYRASLQTQFTDLLTSLQNRKISYADFVKQVNAIMAPLGGEFKGSAEQEAAVNAVRNGIFTSAKAQKFGVALAKGWGIEYSNGAAKRFITPAEMKQLGYRAKGGPVTRGRPYVVGEGGEPELFVPGQSGTVVPFSKMGGRSGGDMYLTRHGDVHINNRREVERAFRRAARQLAH